MWWIVPILLLFGCESRSDTAWQQIDGREGRPLYRAKVAKEWVNEPIPRSNDTREPIGQYQIGGITLWVHNFPGTKIPPLAQVTRWRRQNEGAMILVVNEAHGGFSGLRFEAESEEQKVIAWAMQIDQEHDQVLANLPADESGRSYFDEMRSDYTIKAQGTKDEWLEHEEAIRQFARSFELIQPIPRRR